MSFLIAHAANIDATAPNGTSALMMAIREHHPETARLLINEGADVNHRNADGATALSWARRGDETEIAEELHRAGARD